MSQAIIFDFDGVIADSEVLSNTILAETVSELGIPTTLEDAYRDYMGKRFEGVLVAVEKALGRTLPPGFAEGYQQRSEVASDGSIVLGFADGDGKPAAVTLAVGRAGALVMTLPKLIEEALRRQYRDHSLRYTYPLASWSLERATDQMSGIVTLATRDGFSVRFSIQPRQQSELGEALANGIEAPPGALAN